MAWHPITPELTSLLLAPVDVIAGGWKYPAARVVYEAPLAWLRSPDGDTTWLSGTVAGIDQDDQQWRVSLTDGTVWDVARRTGGCACSGAAPHPIV